MNCHKFQVHVLFSFKSNVIQEEKIQFVLETVESRLSGSDLNFEHFISREEEDVVIEVSFPERSIAQGYNMNLINEFFNKLSTNIFTIQEAEVSICADEYDQYFNHHKIASPIVVI